MYSNTRDNLKINFEVKKKLHKIGAHTYSNLAMGAFFAQKSMALDKWMDGWVGGW